MIPDHPRQIPESNNPSRFVSVKFAPAVTLLRRWLQGLKVKSTVIFRDELRPKVRMEFALLSPRDNASLKFSVAQEAYGKSVRALGER
jgi:hypothetical protein